MTQIQQIAIHKLSKRRFQNSFEKIALCERFGIPLRWAQDAVYEICTRVNNVGVDEGRELSRDWLVAILWARQGEMRHVSSISHWSKKPQVIEDNQLEEENRIVGTVIGALGENNVNVVE